MRSRAERGSGTKVGDYAKRLDNLNKKKSIFLTPLNKSTRKPAEREKIYRRER